MPPFTATSRPSPLANTHARTNVQEQANKFTSWMRLASFIAQPKMLIGTCTERKRYDPDASSHA
jgi:hypothetical protein